MLIGDNGIMSPANRRPEPTQPEDPSSARRSGLTKPQKRLLFTLGAVLVLALIGWLIDTLAPMPKESSSAGVSIVVTASPYPATFEYAAR